MLDQPRPSSGNDDVYQAVELHESIRSRPVCGGHRLDGMIGQTR